MWNFVDWIIINDLFSLCCFSKQLKTMRKYTNALILNMKIKTGLKLEFYYTKTPFYHRYKLCQQKHMEMSCINGIHIQIKWICFRHLNCTQYDHLHRMYFMRVFFTRSSVYRFCFWRAKEYIEKQIPFHAEMESKSYFGKSTNIHTYISVCVCVYQNLPLNGRSEHGWWRFDGVCAFYFEGKIHGANV